MDSRELAAAAGVGGPMARDGGLGDRADRVGRPRRMGWIALSVAAVLLLLLAATVSRLWGGRGAAASAPATVTPPELAECEPSGHRIGLAMEPAADQERVEGEVAECELLIEPAPAEAWPVVGLRPVVHGEVGDPPRTVVRVDVFEVTKPGQDDQGLTFVSSIGVPEGGTGRLEAPGRGTLSVTVTSIARAEPAQ